MSAMPYVPLKVPIYPTLIEYRKYVTLTEDAFAAATAALALVEATAFTYAEKVRSNAEDKDEAYEACEAAYDRFCRERKRASRASATACEKADQLRDLLDENGKRLDTIAHHLEADKEKATEKYFHADDLRDEDRKKSD